MLFYSTIKGHSQRVSFLYAKRKFITQLPCRQQIEVFVQGIAQAKYGYEWT